MENTLRDFMKSIPSMDELLSLPWTEPYKESLGRETVKALFNEVLVNVRKDALNNGVRDDASAEETVTALARELIADRAERSLRELVNATGVVVHTNLGRSPLPDEALSSVMSVARGYSTLEYSLKSGSRDHRNSHVEWLLCRMTGAEAAIVVNNNAGAVLLALAATATGREVIVSRGELVEIGGSFRIPDILSFSGAKMVEIGCTNCTHFSDYERAVTDDTALLLKVHPSNFKVDGFTESVSREELAELAESRGLLLMEDLGSGLLEEIGTPELDGEATVRECLAAGVDLVTFSGDKLLGGPQIGCIAGSKVLIGKLRNHQLLRALRVDKMTLAAFESILRMYVRGDSDKIPTLSMLRVSDEILEQRALALNSSINALFEELSSSAMQTEITETVDAVGGGAFPTTGIPGRGVTLSSKMGLNAEKLAIRLREASIPVITGIRDNKLVFHVRTLQPGDEGKIIKSLRTVFTNA